MKPPEQLVRVYWYDHDCEYISKYCEQNHTRTSLVPRSTLLALEVPVLAEESMNQPYSDVVRQKAGEVYEGLLDLYRRTSDVDDGTLLVEAVTFVAAVRDGRAGPL